MIRNEQKLFLYGTWHEKAPVVYQSIVLVRENISLAG